VIDFRYHLVSLVSVFMALAIGVVLGAGPLKESIGDTLSNQVDGLVRDKTALQQAVANRDQQIGNRDTFVTSVSGPLVAGQLGGRSVVLVTLPGTAKDDADAVAEVLKAGGAELTGQVALQDRWFDPAQKEFRRTLAASQLQYVDPKPPASAGADGELSAVLARAVLTGDIAKAGEQDAEAETILGALTGGDLVAVQGKPQRRATAAVVLAPLPDKAPGAGDRAWVDATSSSVTALLPALDSAGTGTVLGGPLETATGDGLLVAVRGNKDVTKDVSTVDSANTPMGRITIVLALREQLAGDSGQYGFGQDVTAPTPTPVQAQAAGSGG
jgi:hypothetical protein